MAAEQASDADRQEPNAWCPFIAISFPVRLRCSSPFTSRPTC